MSVRGCGKRSDLLQSKFGFSADIVRAKFKHHSWVISYSEGRGSRPVEYVSV